MHVECIEKILSQDCFHVLYPCSQWYIQDFQVEWDQSTTLLGTNIKFHSLALRREGGRDNLQSIVLSLNA